MNLFGLDRALTPTERKALAAKPKLGGHAAPPGTGPKGETCGSCEHICHKRMAKTYLKCWRNQANWTGGSKSDIRARDPACSKWEAKRGGE